MHNPSLADKQGLSELDREVVDHLHLLRECLEMIADENVDKSVDLLKMLYKHWLSNEKLLQKIWKFEENPDYIKFWRFPGCECPKMDNEDTYPYGRYVISGACPIHGDNVCK